MNKKYIYIGAVITLLLLAGLAIWLFQPFFGKKSVQQPTSTKAKKTITVNTLAIEERPYITFIPKSKIEPKSQGHWITFIVDNTGKFKQLEYEFEYTTGSMIQGGLGRIDFSKERPPVSKEIAFGSESKGKYKYDEGVYTGQFTFTFSNGEDAALRADFNLQNAGENNGIFYPPDAKVKLETGKDLKSGDYLIIASTLGLPEPVNKKVIAGPYGFYADSSRSLSSSTITFEEAGENAQILIWNGKKYQELTTKVNGGKATASVSSLGTFVLTVK